MAHSTTTAAATGTPLTELDIHFSDIMAACPYGLPSEAVYHQAVFREMPDHIMQLYLAAGYRRNGNCLYSMRCPDCSRCTPLRLDPVEFAPNRNQRRVLRRNRDVIATPGPLQLAPDSIRNCNAFLATRYPDVDNSAEEYYRSFFINTLTTSMEIRYHAAGKLIGVAIVDYGVAWLSAVYYYFDPDQADRSPGTYNILHLIEFCRQQQIDQLYLGFWISDVAAMRYKNTFKPHWLLVNGHWSRNPHNHANMMAL